MTDKSKKQKKDWKNEDEEQVIDTNDKKPRVQVTHYTREREDQGQIIKETIKRTVRLFPVRKQVLERKQWKKYGEVSKLKWGEHKQGDYLLGQGEVRIEAMDSSNKEEIDIVNKFMAINTEAVKFRKEKETLQMLQQQGFQENEKESEELFPDEAVQPRTGLDKLREAKSASGDQTTLQIQNIINLQSAESQEQQLKEEQDFKQWIEDELKNLFGIRPKFNIKLPKIPKSNRFRGVAYISFDDPNRASKAFDLFETATYSYSVLEVGWAKPMGGVRR